MKKLNLLFAALFYAAIVKAQIQPMGNGMQPMGNGASPTTYTWTTDLYSVQTNIDANLGTASYDPLNFYTNGQKRMVIDENGILNPLYPIKLGTDDALVINYMPRSSSFPAVLSFKPGHGGNPNFQFFKPIVASCNAFARAVIGGSPPTQYVDTVTTVNIFERMLQIQASQNANATTALNMGLLGDDGIVALEPNPTILGETQGVGKLKLNPMCKNDVEICEGGGLTKIFYSAKVGGNFDVNGKTTIGGQTQIGGNHTNAMLTVNGKIVGKEVVVTLSNWADYVFNKGYKLQSLESLETYIKQNKHLPNVPSANEVETNGANLGDLVKIQMEKIEELTLYMIELKKESEALKAEVEVLKSKNLKGKSRK